MIFCCVTGRRSDEHKESDRFLPFDSMIGSEKLEGYWTVFSCKTTYMIALQLTLAFNQFLANISLLFDCIHSVPLPVLC